jgi:5-methylcytosine-specific restriction endonuclease McrA
MGRSDRSKKARHARQAAQRRGAVISELVYYDEIYERDEGICQLCYQPVTYAKGTMDHKIPIGKGGPHIKSNVQLAHYGCNHQKGSKVHEFSLRPRKGRQTPGSL